MLYGIEDFSSILSLLLVHQKKIRDMKNGSEDIYSKFPKEYLGLLFVAFGAIIVVGAWFDWDWIFQGDGKIINIAWISNTFGRNVARIIMGIGGALIMLIGILIFCLMR